MSIGPNAERTLRFYLHVLRRHKLGIIATAFLGLALSSAWSFRAIPQYAATAQLLVRPAGRPAAPGAGRQPIARADVLTELQLVTSEPVVAMVRQTLGPAAKVSAAEIGPTDVIGISAAAASPARAALIANAYARIFVKYRRTTVLRNITAAEEQLRKQASALAKRFRSLPVQAKSSAYAAALLNQESVLRERLAQTVLNRVNSSSGAELVTPARPPTSPISPKRLQDGLLGLAAGLIAGTGAAFLRDNLDESLPSREAVEYWGAAPVLAQVPVVAEWKQRSQAFMVSSAGPASQAAEAYRSLRTSIQFACQQREVGVLVVTSPAAAEGKTSAVSNLGLGFAQAGERVVLVSCDLRRPRVGDFVGVNEQPGLTDVLLGEISLPDALRQVPGTDGLWLLPAGPLPADPAGLLGGTRAQAVFTALREGFDLVLLDSPPVLPVPDCILLSKQADATLLVVTAAQTRRGDLRRAAERLSRAHALVIGMVLNQVPEQSGYGPGPACRHGYGSKPRLSATRGSG